MSMYKYVRNLWKRPKDNPLWKERLIKWRRDPVSIRLEKPTRIDRARSLGYKAKPGIFVVRQRVRRGGHTRPHIKKGRRPKHNRQRMVLEKNYQQIAEERCEKKYVNCSVLNSYWVAEDAIHKWFEIILVDRNHPVIMADKKMNWMSAKRGRAQRGLTAAAKKSRGLLNKGIGAEKLRPSKKASFRRKLK